MDHRPTFSHVWHNEWLNPYPGDCAMSRRTSRDRARRLACPRGSVGIVLHLSGSATSVKRIRDIAAAIPRVSKPWLAPGRDTARAIWPRRSGMSRSVLRPQLAEVGEPGVGAFDGPSHTETERFLGLVVHFGSLLGADGVGVRVRLSERGSSSSAGRVAIHRAAGSRGAQRRCAEEPIREDRWWWFRFSSWGSAARGVRSGVSRPSGNVLASLSRNERRTRSGCCWAL